MRECIEMERMNELRQTYRREGGTMNDQLIETLSNAAHKGWMAGKIDQGINSRKSEWGEELMVPYELLTERAKDLDRSMVKAVLGAIERTGHMVVSRPIYRDSGDEREA